MCPIPGRKTGLPRSLGPYCPNALTSLQYFRADDPARKHLLLCQTLVFHCDVLSVDPIAVNNSSRQMIHPLLMVAAECVHFLSHGDLRQSRNFYCHSPAGSQDFAPEFQVYCLRTLTELQHSMLNIRPVESHALGSEEAGIGAGGRRWWCG